MSTQPLPQATIDRAPNGAYRNSDTRAAWGADGPALARLDLDTLARRCAAENERYRAGQPSDASYAYEIFRRALVERDEGAWEYLYNMYRGLVEHWVRHSTAFASGGEDSDILVGEAFTRFWRAIPPERFEQFPTVAALMHYLQLCAGCAAIDAARARGAALAAEEKLFPLDNIHQRSPDEEVLERIGREELWSYIAARLHDEAERVVIVQSFVHGLKPGEICDARADLFASAKEVYSLKRNVLERLGRDPGLRRLLR